jgi:hypothetical protein
MPQANFKDYLKSKKLVYNKRIIYIKVNNIKIVFLSSKGFRLKDVIDEQ